MRKVLYIAGFFIKSWEVSILLFLPYIQTQNKITIAQIGFLSAVMSLTQIGINIFAGQIVEKVGSKHVITIALSAFFFTWLFIGMQGNIFLLVIVYALAGMSVGIFNPVANAIVAQISDKQRGREMGNFSAITDSGRVIASSATAWLIVTFHYMTIAFFYAILTAIITIFFVNKKSISMEKDAERIKVTFLSLIQDKKYALSVCIGMLDTFASASLYIFIPLLLLPKGISFASTGILTSLFFIGYMLGRLFLGRRADVHGYIPVLVTAELFMAACIIGLIYVQQLFLIAILIFLLGVFTRGTSPIIRAMVADAVGEKAKFHKAYSFYSFAVNSSSVVSRATFGIFAATIGIQSVFYLASIVVVLTLIPILKYRNV